MSFAILELTQSAPVIKSINLTGITGDSILMQGDNFKYGIINLSGQDLKSNNSFTLSGEYKQNISGGINNNIDEDSIQFTLPNNLNEGTKYNIYLFNNAGISVNNAILNVIGRPKISGISIPSGLPDEYVTLSGKNFDPNPNITLIDVNGNKTNPEFFTQLYSIKNIDIISYGTGYNVGDRIIISGQKSLSNNTYGILNIAATGISGSAGGIEILNSGIFTVPYIDNLALETTGKKGDGLIFNIEYENYTSGNLDYLSFKIPYNVKKIQDCLIENLRYKNQNGDTFYNFQVLGIPEIYSLSSYIGTIDQDQILISGDNLNYVTNVLIGDFDVAFSGINDQFLLFNINNFAETNYINVSGKYGKASSTNIFNVVYPPMITSGFDPGDYILAGTGTIIKVSGKYLQRLKYLNLGVANVLSKDISHAQSGTIAYFPLPNVVKTCSVYGYSVDYTNSGSLFLSPSTNNLIIIDQKLDTSLLDFNYTSGINAARYLDELEFFTPIQFTGEGDYGNIKNSDIFFLPPTGYTWLTGSFNVSGIKTINTDGLLRVKVPREVDNPQCRIKIKRNKFKDEYILPTDKSVNILPTIYDIGKLNSLENSPTLTKLPGGTGLDLLVRDGLIKVSGINAYNATKLVFSGYSGNLNIFGFKNTPTFIPLDISGADTSQIDTGNNLGYTVFTSRLGGDYTGSGEAFLNHFYYNTGYGYENYNITQNKNIRVYPVSGFRPLDSFAFTSSRYLEVDQEYPFSYEIQTNTLATQYEIYPTTVYGWGKADYPRVFGTGEYIFSGVSNRNKIEGVPYDGGTYFVKIRALNGTEPDEGMVLQLRFGVSGRSLASPAVFYRGPWKSGTFYVGTTTRRDIVKTEPTDGSSYWYATRSHSGDNFNKPNALSPFWIRFDTELNSVATQILLSEQSNILSTLTIGQKEDPLLFTGAILSANDTNFNVGTGFFIGYDNGFGSPVTGKPLFRIGSDADGYIKWDSTQFSVFGALSGVITSSRRIKNSQNIVDADYSLVAGYGNNIQSKGVEGEKVANFAVGLENILSKTTTSSIAGGKSNLITGTDSFKSVTSNIAGGESNYILGSFSNIAGGKGNYIQTIGTGTSKASVQINSLNFNELENVPDSTVYIYQYNLGLFTNDVAIFNSYEKSGETDPKHFKIDIFDIESSRYKLSFPSNLTSQDLSNHKINSFIGVLDTKDIAKNISYSANVFSGSYAGNRGDCQCKIWKTGIPSGATSQRIYYPTPFTGTIGNTPGRQDIIILTNIQKFDDKQDVDNFYNSITFPISSIDKDGFNINFMAPLKQTTTGFFLAINTGNFTGYNQNAGQILQVGINYPFYSINPNINNFDPNFDIPLANTIGQNDSLKVFGNAINLGISGQSTDQYLYYNKKLFHNSTGFRVGITTDTSNPTGKISGIKYEYIATNIDFDKNSILRLQGGDAYGRYSDFGYTDVGSSTIGGGTGNLIIGSVSYIGAGIKNKIVGDYDIIPGGRNNQIIDYDNPDASLADFSSILGGRDNIITGHVTQSVIVNGKNNIIINKNHEIDNEVNCASIINGENHLISGDFSTIINGKDNAITGDFSTVINGKNNRLSGDYNYAFGNNIRITGSGCIFLKDLNNNSVEFSTTVDNAMYLSYKTIILDINKIPTGSDQVPISGLYRNGTFLQIRLS